MDIKRRGFLKGLAGAFVMTQAGLILPHVPERIYSFAKPRIIGNDFIVLPNGDIRFVGDQGNQYTVLELHRYLQDLADEPPGSGNAIDITSSTPSYRYTDNIIDLAGGLNIDDTAATHLTTGSISQRQGGSGDHQVYVSMMRLG